MAARGRPEGARGRVTRRLAAYGSEAVATGRRAVHDARTRLRRGPVPGLLSFVVPVYDVEEYLDECLQSLRDQDHRAIEIVCVDDGSPDDSVRIVRRHMRQDPRVRLVRRANGGLSAARNTGVAAARGEFLAFVDSDDTVPAHGYHAAVASLESTGSDFAVLPYQRLRHRTIRPAGPWIRAIHQRPRQGITVDDFPDVLANAIMCSKVFRRAFWDRLGLHFVEGILYEDQQVSAEAYARARAFDVLTTPVYNWRVRNDRSSISQAKHEASNLRAQVEAAQESLRMLERHASARVVTERLAQLLSFDIPQFTTRVLGCSDEFWEVLSRELPALVAATDRGTYLARVPPQHKVVQHLVVTGQRAACERFLEAGGLEVRRAETADEEVGLVVRLPLWRDPEASVPDECFRVAEQQVRARTILRAVRTPRPSEAELDCWAFLENIDLGRNSLQVRAFATPAVPDLPEEPAAHGDDVELAVESFSDDAADELEVPGSGVADYRRGAHRITVPLDRLGPGAWHVRVELAQGDRRRSALLGDPVTRGTAGLRHAARAAGGRPASLAATRQGPLTISVAEDDCWLEEASFEDGTLVLVGSGVRPASVELVAGPRRGEGEAQPEPPRALLPEPDAGDGGRWVVRAPVPPAGPRGRSSWRVRATVDSRGTDLRHAPVAVPSPDAGDPRLSVDLDDKGRARVTVRTRAATVRQARVEEDRLVLTLDTAGIRAEEYDVVFVARPLTAAATLHRLTADGDRVEVVLPFRQEQWGAADRVLPSAAYELVMRHRSRGERLPVEVGRELLDTLPVDRLVGPVRCRLRLRAGRPVLVVDLSAPLPPGVRGLRNQLRLEPLACAGAGDERSAFFRTLYGEVAGDSAAAVHAELRRRGSDLTVYWSVADLSVEVPPGGVPLLEGTEEWYARLGGARYVMVNVHQPAWYRKPAGQVLVQTLHGYPYKGMGRRWWARQGFTPSRIASYLDRAADWDYLVSPARYATPHLLQAFFRPEDAAAVRVLEVGYPRNDILLSDEGATVRAATRAALGIRDDQVAVLYAPTFRNYLSHDGRTAQAVDFFDAEAAAAALGSSYVVMVRGHAFHARAGVERALGERVLDVTYHPDVTALSLASDAAVLDYSSLRFDYALLRRPMIFLVPDEEEYHRSRPAILDFGPTAPGPRAATTGDVVDLLRDADALRRQYAADVERFVATYMEREDGHATARVVDAVFRPEDRGHGGSSVT